MAHLDVHNIADGVVRGEAERVKDEAGLELLDLGHHGRLLLGSAVVVDDTDTAVQLFGGWDDSKRCIGVWVRGIHGASVDAWVRLRMYVSFCA